MLVAPASVPAFGYDYVLTVFQHIRQDQVCFPIADQRTDGNLDYRIVPFFARTVVSFSRMTVLGFIFFAIANILQRMQLCVCKENDIAAITAVTAVRSSFWDELFTMKAYTAVSAIACLYFDLGQINEFHILYVRFRNYAFFVSFSAPCAGESFFL